MGVSQMRARGANERSLAVPVAAWLSLKIDMLF